MRCGDSDSLGISRSSSMSMSVRQEAMNSTALLVSEGLTTEDTEDIDGESLAVVFRFARFKWTRGWLAFIVSHQNLNATFCLIQALLAFARERHALFEQFKAALQRHVALFKFANHALEFFK